MSRPMSPGTSQTARGSRVPRSWRSRTVLAVAAVVPLTLGLAACGGDDQAGAGNSNSASPSAPSSSAPSSPADSPSGSGTPDAAAPGNGAGTMTVGGKALLPLSQSAGADGSLAAMAGQAVSVKSLPVEDVSAREGFWLGTSETDRVWVKLLPQGGSPVGVKEGQLLDLEGKFVANGADFAKAEGVDDGADQLTKQAAHIEVAHEQPRVVAAS